jgi:DNA-binding CsgD family transcriptional regulator
VLNTVYGLSRAEVRLCQTLIQGQTLLEASMTLDISRNTAKTHLARVFDKTGVHSQAGLLRMLALSGRA